MDRAKLNQLIGQNIRRLRTAAGKSQEELAAECGIDMRYLGGIERGQENPTAGVLADIAKALRCSPAALLADPKARG